MSAIGYHHGCTTSRNGGHAHVVILPTKERYWGSLRTSVQQQNMEVNINYKIIILSTVRIFCPLDVTEPRTAAASINGLVFLHGEEEDAEGSPLYTSAREANPAGRG